MRLDWSSMFRASASLPVPTLTQWDTVVVALKDTRCTSQLCRRTVGPRPLWERTPTPEAFAGRLGLAERQLRLRYLGFCPPRRKTLLSRLPHLLLKDTLQQYAVSGS